MGSASTISLSAGKGFRVDRKGLRRRLKSVVDGVFNYQWPDRALAEPTVGLDGGLGIGRVERCHPTGRPQRRYGGIDRLTLDKE